MRNPTGVSLADLFVELRRLLTLADETQDTPTNHRATDEAGGGVR